MFVAEMSQMFLCVSEVDIVQRKIIVGGNVGLEIGKNVLDDAQKYVAVRDIVSKPQGSISYDILLSSPKSKKF